MLETLALPEALTDHLRAHVSTNEWSLYVDLLEDRPALLRRLQRRALVSKLSDRQLIANALARAAKAGLVAPRRTALPLAHVAALRPTAGIALQRLIAEARAGRADSTTALLTGFMADGDEAADGLLARLPPATLCRILEDLDAMPPMHIRLLCDAIELGSPRVAFWTTQMSERGTEVALYDYADYAESMLGVTSYILYDAVNEANIPAVVERFDARFGGRCIGLTHQLE